MLDGEVHNILWLVGNDLLQQLTEYVMDIVLLQILLDLFAEFDLFFSVHKLQIISNDLKFKLV